MPRCAKTAITRANYQLWIWFIWSCLKLYLIGIYALILELFRRSPKKNEEADGTGLVAVVTGGSSGIGYQITRKLATRNVHVIIASRCETEAMVAIAKIKAEKSTTKVEFMEMDLCSLASVRSFGQRFQARNLPLHILINNAGVMFVPFQETEDGLETHFQVNYLSHLFLTCLLIDTIKASGTQGRCARVINVSSVAHFTAETDDIQPSMFSTKTYSPHASYAASKLAIILCSHALSTQLQGSTHPVTVNTVHPGVVNSNLYKNVHWSIKWIMDIIRIVFFKTTVDGANQVVFLALSSEIEGHSGGYYDNYTAGQSKSCTYSRSCQADLMQTSSELLGIDVSHILS